MAFESMAVSALPIVTKAHNILAKDEVCRVPVQMGQGWARS